MLPLLAMISAALFPAVPPASAGDVVKRVQAYYAETQKLRADFRQDYTNTTFGKTSQSDGRLFVAKPGKMRWDYDKPEKKYFISDGTTLWVYEKAAGQAIQQTLKDQILPVAVTFLYGQGDLATEFSAELDPGKYGGKDAICVKLTPRKPEAQYKNLWLVVDPADFHVRESVILEASDNINHFTFFNIKQNALAKVEDKFFTFIAPSGVIVKKLDPAGGVAPSE